MLEKEIERILPKVAKPARYIGQELNVIRKDPERQKVRVCLAFPDVYDIGQSYMGFDILYHVLNTRPSTLCERTFAPWTDMEEQMRSGAIPLWSLESYLPVSSFDVLGFTLQYELHYTSVVNMLDLAGIPVFASDRGEDDPLVIGGGTNCANPEPVADFFDAFLLGDGEEAFPEIIDAVEQSRDDGLSRADTLLRLAMVEGVYVPSLYRVKNAPDGSFAGVEPVCDEAAMPVRSRIVREMKPEFYPDKPLVPVCEVVHDRLAVEIMRGCARGCRFCGAGMTYRPQRMRPVNDVVGQVVNGIRATGWEDVSLLSLSTSDYDGLESVVRRIGRELKDSHVSISLSSLRADNFSLAIADAVAGGKKTSLTFAVEAGSQRLRNVINKNLTEEQLLETVETALKGGWNAFKVYFMIGHPTETDEDVTGIAGLLNKLGGILKQYHGRRINVTISAFSPKPMTPFQWEPQASVEELDRKMQLIRSNVTSRAVNIRQSDSYVAMLECLLGRGGREMSTIVLNAWKRGCRLDGWSEMFDRETWRSVLADEGIVMENGGGGLVPGSPLPWSHLHFGVDEEFLIAEYDRAKEGSVTSDCTQQCNACGPYAPFCASLKKTQAVRESDETSVPEREQGTLPGMYGRKRRHKKSAPAPTGLLGTRVRIKFGKTGFMRFIGHLDTVRLINRTLRRSGIPLAYSQGFHPHPKISFGPPLPLGMMSTAEYADFSLSEPFPDLESALKRNFPDGLSFLGIRPIQDKAVSLNEAVDVAEYHVMCDPAEEHLRHIRMLLESGHVPVRRMTKKGEKEVDIRPGILAIDVNHAGTGGFTMRLGLGKGKSAKPSEVLGIILGEQTTPDVTRTELYADRNGTMVPPFELTGMY